MTSAQQQKPEKKSSAPIYLARLTRFCGGSAGTGDVRGEGDGSSARAPSGEGPTGPPPGWFAISSGF